MSKANVLYQNGDAYNASLNGDVKNFMNMPEILWIIENCEVRREELMHDGINDGPCIAADKVVDADTLTNALSSGPLDRRPSSTAT